MKRSLLAAVLIGALVAGCGGSNKPSPAKTPAVGQVTTPTATATTTATTPATSTNSTTPKGTTTTRAKRTTTPKPTSTRTTTTPAKPPRKATPKKPKLPPPGQIPARFLPNRHRAREMGSKPVVRLSGTKPSAVCPGLRTDLKHFAEASEAPLVATTYAEIQESYKNVSTKSVALQEAVKGLAAAFPHAKGTVGQLEATIASYRSTLTTTGPHGNLTLLAGPTERVMRAGREVEALCTGE